MTGFEPATSDIVKYAMEVVDVRNNFSSQYPHCDDYHIVNLFNLFVRVSIEFPPKRYSVKHRYQRISKTFIAFIKNKIHMCAI